MNSNAGNQSYFDGVLERDGNERLSEVFSEMAENRRQNALWNLNDNRLSFPALYALIPQIDQFGLLPRLNTRAVAALNVTAKALRDDALEAKLPKSTAVQPATLRWMLLSAEAHTGRSDRLDRVIDGVAALLFCLHRDAASLPAAVRILFERHRQGLLIHDLAWSLFNAVNMDAVRQLAAFLSSEDTRSAALAARMLHIGKPTAEGWETPDAGAQKAFMTWLEENQPYAYFSGESFQQTSEPEPLRINQEAKYLRRRVSAETGKPLRPLNLFEQKRLAEFQRRESGERRLLAEYSARAYRSGAQMWNRWMSADIERQVAQAKSEGGERV